MPLYYFDLCDGDGLAVDEVGTRLKSLQAATDEAVRVLDDLASQAEQDPQSSYLYNMTIEVRDEKGYVTEVAPTIRTRH
jgi:hypothetical protein